MLPHDARMSIAQPGGVTRPDSRFKRTVDALSPSRSHDLDRYAWASLILHELLPVAPSKTVADIGAGSAAMRSPVEGAGGRWFGFDVAPSSGLVTQWDLDDPHPAGMQQVGIVLLLDVVEHLCNPWRAMEHVAQLLLPGGYLALTTPNPRWSRSRLHALAFGVPTCFTRDDMELNHHVFTPWPHILEKLLRDVGLSTVSYDTIDGHTALPHASINYRYPVRLALALLNRYLEQRDPSAKGMS